MTSNTFSYRVLVSCAALLAWVLHGCGGDAARTFGGGGTGGQATGAADGGLEHPASGGAPGNGGMPAGTGGATAGTGGTTGSGGATATGGAPNGSGGSASGGTTGGGGTGGTISPATCDQLSMDYQRELPRARACTIGLGLSQCQMAASAGLGCFGNCTIYVQDASTLNELKRKWISNNCDSTIRLCPASACVNGQPGNCFITGGSPTPQCQNSPVP